MLFCYNSFWPGGSSIHNSIHNSFCSNKPHKNKADEGTAVGLSHHQQRRTGSTPKANCQETGTYMFPLKTPKEGNKAKPKHNRRSHSIHNKQ